MKEPKSRLLHLRFSRLYLLAIGAVSLLLLILSAISLEHSRQVIRSISLAGLSLDGERLAVEIERRAWKLSEDCLSDPELQNLASTFIEKPEPPGDSVFQSKLENAGKRHPIAEHFFVLLDGKMGYPQLKNQPSPLPASLLSTPKSQSERQFVSLIRTADEKSRTGRYSEAATLLERACDLQISDGLKVLGISRLATNCRNAAKPTEAARAWHRFDDSLGDYLNESGVPYALVAAFELDVLTDGLRVDSSNRLLELYRDLLAGRWYLSERVTETLKVKLEKRLGNRIPENTDTRFIQHLKLAHLVEESLRSMSPAGHQRILTRSIADGGLKAQLYWVFLPRADRQSRILAFTANLAWVSGALLRQSRDDLRISGRPVAGFTIAPSGAQAKSEVTIPFRTVFPFLELRLPEGGTEATRSAVRIEIALVGGIVVLMACLLWMIGVLLSRVSKEISMLRLRSDFLTGVSHELKTPLTLMTLHAETLLANEELSEEERRNCCQVICREGGRLNQMITNLLHLSRMEKAKLDYKISEGDLVPVVERTAGICSEWLGRQGFSIRVDIGRDLPLVRFDPEKVSQVLLNLVDNARKYSGESRSIEIRLGSEGSDVFLEVRDFGLGIPAEEHQRVFEKFYRASNAGEKGGSGLGLYLARDIMAAHGGRIELESEVDRGSCFRLVFPSSGVAREEAAASRVSPEHDERAADRFLWESGKKTRI